MSSRRLAVVTGANKGIGFEIGRALCKGFDGDVFLTARDEGRGLEAIKQLNQDGLNPKFHKLDIDDAGSINVFRAFLEKSYAGVDVLVNNAGIAFKKAATDPFGVQAEVTTRVNFGGTLRLCEAIFPLLTDGARVVNVSSSAGFLPRLQGKEPEATELRKRFSDPELTTAQLSELIQEFVESAKSGTHAEKGWPASAYVVSKTELHSRKVAVSALTRIQQREMDKTRPNSQILINSVHPGYVDTDMTSHKGVLSPVQGAAAPAYLALLPAHAAREAQFRGGYFWHDNSPVDWINGPTPSAM